MRTPPKRGAFFFLLQGADVNAAVELCRERAGQTTDPLPASTSAVCSSANCLSFCTTSHYPVLIPAVPEASRCSQSTLGCSCARGPRGKHEHATLRSENPSKRRDSNHPYSLISYPLIACVSVKLLYTRFFWLGLFSTEKR